MKQLSAWGSFYWVVPAVVISVLVVMYVERKPWKKTALWLMLGVWFGALTYLLFLYRLPGGLQHRINTEFFHMYRFATRHRGTIGNNQSLRQILFNVLLYVPFGAVVFSLSKKAWLTIVIGFGLSVMTEVLQYWTGLGMADVDDVISNWIGLVIGTTVIKLLTHWIRSKGKRSSI